MLDLEVIKTRAEAATPGPWNWDTDWLRQGTEQEGGEVVMRVEVVGEPDETEAQLVILTRDATFIAHAREDVPALLAEVERLRADNRQLRCALVAGCNAVAEVNENYGQGLSIAGWHLNGDLDPLDNWITDWGLGEALDEMRAALKANPIPD